MFKEIKRYNLGVKFRQIRSCPVNLGDGRRGRLFVHADTPNLDPWCESMAFPEDTLKLTLMSDEGVILWRKDLGKGIIPGIWFEPVMSFDLDRDGIDEIWLLGNRRPELPFTFEHRTLMRLDALTGEKTGEWQWPTDMEYEKISHAYRCYLMCGYAHGEPVLMCAQGAYSDMYLQGYGAGMVKKWDIAIKKDDPGARAAHHTTVFDINGDGVDELFWGERILSVEDGHEIACGDPEKYHAHSDILTVFEDPADGKRYVYTCREGQEEDGIDRVVTYDDQMNVVWKWPEGGHMHSGWVATFGPGRKNIAMAMSLAIGIYSSDQHHSEKIYYYFDAVTGETVAPPLPYEGNQLLPIDFNGDGLSEFLIRGGDHPDKVNAGDVIDGENRVIGHLDGEEMTFGRLIPGMYGQQVMMAENANGIVKIYGDDEAAPGPCDLYPEYHENMQHMMASGYNCINANFGL